MVFLKWQVSQLFEIDLFMQQLLFHFQKQNQKQQLQQQQQQQQHQLTPSTTSPALQSGQPTNTMFSHYGTSPNQPQSGSSIPTWGNTPSMVTDPWQNNYNHPTMAAATSAFVATPQFSSGFGQPYGYAAHRPLNVRQSTGFEILSSPSMSGPSGPGAPSAAFVGLNVSMSPRGAATVQGNFLPGYPHRPTEESSLSSDIVTSEGHSGHHNR